MEEKTSSVDLKDTTPQGQAQENKEEVCVVKAPEKEVEAATEKTAEAVKEPDAPQQTKKKKEPKPRSAGYKVARAFWIIFQVLSVFLFGIAIVALILSPIFPFISGGALGSLEDDAGAMEQIAAGIGVVLLVILGIFATVGMILVSLIVNLGSIGAGAVGFLISIIARPGREKWKALVSFGVTTLPPVILAVVEFIMIVIAVICYFVLKQ